MLEITAHAVSREAAIAFLQAVNIATVTPDRTIHHKDHWTALVPDDDPDAEPGEMTRWTFYSAAAIPKDATEVEHHPAWDEFIPSNNVIVPIAEVQIHPCRPEETIAIVKTPAVMDGMEVVTPAEIVPGFHFNMRFYGASEATLRKPEPEGGWPPGSDFLADQTYVLELVAGRTGTIPNWTASAEDQIPPGYEAGQCRAYDPSLIATRANVWA